MIGLSGTLTAASLAQAELIKTLLPRHVQLTRSEPGCLRFDVFATEDPFVWQVDELFLDQSAFDAHQSRTKDSDWGQETAEISRDFRTFGTEVKIRNETPRDTPEILTLLAEAFGGVAEARLVQMLREDGDLAISLVAEAGGQVLGYVALSPLHSERAALALGPLAVTPRAQGLGIASTLVQAAIERAADQIIVVLGEPDFYGRFGFRQVNWDSPYSGSFLQAIGPNLPERARIVHAPAFSSLV